MEKQNLATKIIQSHVLGRHQLATTKIGNLSQRLSMLCPFLQFWCEGVRGKRWIPEGEMVAESEILGTAPCDFLGKVS